MEKKCSASSAGTWFWLNLDACTYSFTRVGVGFPINFLRVCLRPEGGFIYTKYGFTTGKLVGGTRVSSGRYSISYRYSSLNEETDLKEDVEEKEGVGLKEGRGRSIERNDNVECRGVLLF